ncbi:TIGR00730 family Rossman fold protein [Piscinibacter gummiphilus]|uniref:Cytokinin riboside 5'-monophosphate phosphoribohydrolase n=1 Tax=Piscinibacter gummiphilus TaxID=946333 RepID=A0A1W6L394_9BURK|nr:TIGR00730 family Rossman fold protein [Piscinibacter gummiphilus]ARN18749.1 Rossman fold protein, TIGR00730 family [Piscinibacter gummiphilus]ATU63389.1 TIGR00730 family Rossman fold protein [Piscinibacter gummiphilus]GLS95901.1 putative cytokinin riboside 5'-monophosphate phosphoribohydrolase [Piscinibacter gummiphilus]
MTALTTVAVFCGSNFGVSPAYAEAAAALGRTLAARDIGLVYGGTTKGLMGVVADAVLEAGGRVTGVINQRLFDRGHLHPKLTAHEVAVSMRERKARMADLADAFIALPGGLGTLEELLEAATLTQLGDHTKACGVLNVRGFYEPLRALLATATDEGFMKPEHRDMMVIEPDPAALLDALAAWQAPTVTKWIGQPGS